MSRLSSFSGLKWVGSELDEVIRKARDALEEYVEGGGETAVLGPCVEHLSQVRGVLEMLQQRGAERLAEEMQVSARALKEGQAATPKEAAEALMLAMIQLPDYLEKLESGGEDIPIVLLPTINDLRASRGVQSLTEADLVVSGVAPAAEHEVADEQATKNLRRIAHLARPRLHKGLLGWFRGAAPVEGLENLRDVFSELEENSGGDPLLRGLFRTAHAVTEGLLDQSIETDNEVKGLVGRVDRIIKQLDEKGVRSAHSAVQQDVLKDLLVHVSQADSPHPTIQAVKADYDLDRAFPSEEALAEARQRMLAPNADTLAGIRFAAVKELLPIKDTLDLFMRGGREHTAQLLGMETPMRRLASTLDMVGLSDLSQRLRGRAGDIKSVVDAEEPVEDTLLMGIAGDLLYVESSLENVRRETVGAAGDVTQGEMQGLVNTTLEEAALEMAKAKEAIVTYTASPSDTRPLEATPGMFHKVAGALRLISRNEAADVLDQVRGFLQNVLITGRAAPEQRILDSLAEAITGIEYYMEAVGEGRRDTAQILNIARAAFARLEQEPRDEAEVRLPEPEEAAFPPADTGEAAAETVPSSMEAGAGGGEEPAGGPAPQMEIDPEILEIFLEEAREEEPVVRECFERWRETPGDSEALATLRRSFHTLKGSGRLVGAMVIGDFAWSVENLLNRIIDQTIELSGDLTGFLEQAVAVLPELINAQEEGRAAQVDTAGLMAHAGALAGKRSAVAVAPGEAVPEAGVEAVSEQPELGFVVEDSELSEIFEAEAREHLETLYVFLTGCERQPLPCGFHDELVRALHTLAGSARMVGLDPLAVMAKALEVKASASLEQGLGADAEFLGYLKEGSGAIAAMVDALREPSSEVPETDGLVARIQDYVPGKGRTAPMESGEEPLAAQDREEEIVLEGLEKPAFFVEAPKEETPPLEVEETISLEELGELLPGTEVPEEEEILLEGPDELAFSAEVLAEEISLEGLEEVEPATEAPGEVEIPLEAETEPPAVAVEEPVSTFEEISTDPEHLEIFLEEAEELLDLLDGGLRDWQLAPGDSKIPTQLQRTLHTLKGGARLAGIQSVGNLSHALESLVDGMGSGLFGSEQQERFFQAQQAADTLSDQLDAVRYGRPVQMAEGLIQELQSAVAPEETEQWPVEVAAGPLPARREEETEQVTGDRDLVEIFLEEAQELLDQLDNTLRDWGNEPDDKEAPVQLNRNLHTLKGGARMAGIQSIGDLSHALETLLSAFTSDRIKSQPTLMPLAQQALDRLSEQIASVRQERPVQRAADLVAELMSVHGELAGATEPAGHEEAAAESAEEAVASGTVEEEKVVSLRKVVAPEALPPAVTQPVQEQVRVRSDLLNRLVNNSGEISIYRARLEQQNTALGFNLGELEQTVTRLHDQLRQMEIETEAQILYRYEQEHEEGVSSEEDLDPLELDRFSTIQQLSRSLIETVSDLVSIKNLLYDQQKESETLLLQHSRISNDLQDGLLRTRMVPFTQLVPRLRRLVRQTANSLGKQAVLEVFGGEGEMDRSILDRMLAPMEHILRNAISHGIEPPEHRRSAGKNESGKVSIYLTREGNDVIITVLDDGAGLNLEAIRRRAVETGLLESGARIDDDNLMQLVLEPGFSTAKEITQIAGRGVGTDVLVSEVKQLGGSVEIDSQPGRGTSFSIRLPFTLAISESLLVELGDDIFAVPHTTMEGVVRISADDLAKSYDGSAPYFSYAGHEYRVRYLGGLLGTTAVSLPKGARKWLPLLLVRSGEHRVAIQVDHILGNRQVVVKSVGPQLSTVRWISGGTILPDGRVALILDVSALVRLDVVQTMRVEETITPVVEERPTRVMVVDDSITVRKVTTRLLKRHNMEVSTAKDGVDAVALLQEEHPDVMLLDIEMPRMDGYELARHMRSSAELRNIPIIMITSRSGEKHRNIALSLGVRRYLGKPYQETDLLDNIYAVLAEAEVEAEA